MNITEEESWPSEGYLAFQVKTPNIVNFDEDGPLIALDLDQNPDTGSAFYGTEVEIAFQGEGNAREASAVLYRSNGWDFRRVTPPEGWGWGYGPNEVDFFISRAQLGIGPTAGFNIVAASAASHPDTAPDIGTFNYQPIAGTPPPRLGPDRRAPHLDVYSASTVHGRVARLTYWVLDGRGKTAETIRIYRGRRLLKTIQRPLHASNPFDVTQVNRVPRTAYGLLRFSVRVDAAGTRARLPGVPEDPLEQLSRGLIALAARPSGDIPARWPSRGVRALRSRLARLRTGGEQLQCPSRRPDGAVDDCRRRASIIAKRLDYAVWQLKERSQDAVTRRLSFHFLSRRLLTPLYSDLLHLGALQRTGCRPRSGVEREHAGLLAIADGAETKGSLERLA